MSQFIVIIILFSFISCARQVVETREEAMRVHSSLEQLTDDLDILPFQEGLEKHIQILMKRPDQILVFGTKKITARDYAWELNKLIALKDKESLLNTIQNNFEFMEVYGKEKWGEILLTSYYEPLYPARKKPTEKYYQPIYKTPSDLVELNLEKLGDEDLGNFDSKRRVLGGRITAGPGEVPRVVPFYSRQEIDIDQKLKGKKLELYYLDPIHAFFLQIQGSGGLLLEDGTEVRVGYAAQNGWKYKSIGKHLFHVIPKEEMSLQKIEGYLRTLTKEELYDFLKLNPSYVFFRPLEGRGLTTFGNEVVSGRTLAIDSQLFPLGSMAYLTFQKPYYANDEVEVPTNYVETSRVVLAQDTGGAIKSTGRADLYWGQGEKSLRYAGTMRHEAKLWFLVPKQGLLQSENTEK